MGLYTCTYDETYHPAMPMVEITLFSPDTGLSVGPIKAMVDSGSDGTSVPESFLDEIGELSIGTVLMSGIWGERKRVNRYLVTAEIGPHRLYGIHVVGVPDSVGFIVGRNILNHLAITLNGVAHTVEIPMVD